MCGIAGYLTFDTDQRMQSDSVLSAMTDAIRHRGPDSCGHWREPVLGVGLGMRRLAIIDPSPAGQQPMTSSCGRYILVFNGEIYNHAALRSQLEEQGRAAAWRGRSDTEVLVEAISAWGLTNALQAANGMFALAVWDRKSRDLSLAIDRFGEKPLYVGWVGRTLLFGSELKALSTHPAWAGTIDVDALSLFFRHGYIPAPRSIFKHIRKVEPGTVARVSALERKGHIEVGAYWSMHDAVCSATQQPLRIGPKEALLEFERLFLESVKMRMEADVPLGAFLSGGFDSTAVVAAMQASSRNPVKTFTVGFTERAYNEAPFAKAVAAHLGTDHTEIYATAQEAVDAIPRMPQLYDEPFADSSQIPTFLVSQLARQHVTVALSGDGGDELFGGYSRYLVSSWAQPIIESSPRFARDVVAAAIRGIGPRRIDRLHKLMTLGRSRPLVGDRALKFADLLVAPSSMDGYRKIVSAWDSPDQLVLGAREPTTMISSEVSIPKNLGFVETMMYLDLVSYLPGDILTKLDRATMAVSLEGRIPFLDHRLLNFAWRLPLDHKVAWGQGKKIIRKFALKSVPRTLMNRPKSGFMMPIDEWLRGPLRDWAESLLDTRRMTTGGLINSRLITDRWNQHLNGAQNSQSQIWPVLMFEAWSRHNAEQRTVPKTQPTLEVRSA